MNPFEMTVHIQTKFNTNHHSGNKKASEIIADVDLNWNMTKISLLENPSRLMKFLSFTMCFYVELQRSFCVAMKLPRGASTKLLHYFCVLVLWKVSEIKEHKISKHVAHTAG